MVEVVVNRGVGEEVWIVSFLQQSCFVFWQMMNLQNLGRFGLTTGFAWVLGVVVLRSVGGTVWLVLIMQQTWSKLWQLMLLQNLGRFGLNVGSVLGIAVLRGVGGVTVVVVVMIGGAMREARSKNCGSADLVTLYPMSRLSVTLRYTAGGVVLSACTTAV